MRINDRSQLTRRCLLHTGIATGAALSLPTLPAAAQLGQVNKRIIVLGAGLAGLAAAYELKRQGFDVIVLEARERLGGRVHTVRVGNATIDLGGDWIRDERDNPVLELCQRLRVMTRDARPRSVIVFDDEGKRVPAPLYRRMQQRFETVVSRTRQTALLRERAEQDDISMAEALDAEGLRRGVPDAHDKLLNWLVARQVESAAADHADRLSLYGMWANRKEIWYTGGLKMLPGGLSQLAEAMAREVDVRLGHKVTKVEWKAAGGVNVHTPRGKFTGNAAIVTFPPGVMRSRSAPTFEPELPGEKTHAFKRIGIGAANRVALAFDKHFWPGEIDFLGSIEKPTRLFTDWTNMYRRDQKPVLTMWSIGDAAREMESRSDDELAKEAMALLSKAFARTVKQPKQVVVSRWQADDYAQGVWAYLPVGVKAEVIDQLASPIEDRLFFAGDSTDRAHLGTVRGAIASGLREADRLVEAERKQRRRG